MATTPSNTAGILAVLLTNASKTITLPVASTRIGRVLTIKDQNGLASQYPITITPTSGDTIDGLTTFTISQNYDFVTLTATAAGVWVITSQSRNISSLQRLATVGYISSFSTNSISSGRAALALLSSQQIFASSITANKFIGDGSLLIGAGVGAASVTSSLAGLAGTLGLMGYVSSTQLMSTVTGLGTIYNSTIIARGTGISFTSNANQITIANSGVTSIIAGTGISITQTGGSSGTGDVTVNSASTGPTSDLLLSSILIGPNTSNMWVAVGNPTTYLGSPGDNNDTTATHRILYSTDGLYWNYATSGGFSTGFGTGFGVAWNGTMWVAVGTGSTTTTIIYSYDGKTWTSATSGGFTATGYGIAWNGRMWIAVGAGTGTASIRYSYDGKNWLAVTSGGFATSGQGVAWNGSMWVAVGLDSTAANTIQYSYDGLIWTPCVSNGFTYNSAASGGQGVAWGGTMWVAVGNTPITAETIKYSYDGKTWYNCISGGFYSPNAGYNSGYGVAWNGQTWVAVGYNTNANSIQYSYDGKNWLSASAVFTLQQDAPGRLYWGGRAVSWNGTMWVAVGVDDTYSANATIKYSYDGINWTTSLGPRAFQKSPSLLYGGGFGVAYSANPNLAWLMDNLEIQNIKNIPMFIRSTNTIRTSISTIILNNTLSVDKTNNFVNIYGSMALGGNITLTGSLNVGGLLTVSSQTTVERMIISTYPYNIWVAVGYDTTSIRTIRYSYDGINWLYSSGAFPATSGGYCVAWNGKRWIAGGIYMLYSYNGIDWYGGMTGGPSSDVLGIAWNGTMWVAVGNSASATNSITYSYDGITWTDSAGTGFTYGANHSGNAVAWNGSMWVAVGSDSTSANTIQYSYDGINWIPSVSGGFSIGIGGYGVAWNGRMWVAVGSDSPAANTIKYSYNGKNWYNCASGGFSSVGYGVAWNGFMWVAVGADATALNRIQYSYDGINWSYSTSGGGFTTNGQSIAWNGLMWVAGGYDTAAPRYSYDGKNWTTSPSTAFSQRCRCVAYSSNVQPFLKINTIDIPNNQNIPVFVRSTNTIAESFNSIVLNGVLSVYGPPSGSGSNYTSSVGINKTNPAYTLDVNGKISGQLGVFSNGTALTSDRRIKQNIVSADLTLCYSTVRDMPLRRFEFVNSIGETKTDKKQLGFIADELGAIFPKSVNENTANVGEFSTISFVNLDQIHMAHFGATQQLMNIIDQQQSTINGQQLMFQTLCSQVAQLFSTTQLS